MSLGVVKPGGAGGRCANSSGAVSGSRSDVEMMLRDRALSQTMRKSGVIGVMVISVLPCADASQLAQARQPVTRRHIHGCDHLVQC